MSKQSKFHGIQGQRTATLPEKTMISREEFRNIRDTIRKQLNIKQKEHSKLSKEIEKLKSDVNTIEKQLK